MESAWRAVAGQVGGLSGNQRRELLRDAVDPRGYVAVTDWADESALHDYEHGPVAARFADAVRRTCEPPAPGDRRVLREHTGVTPTDGGTPATIVVDVELRVPAARRAEFARGHAEVVTRMAGVPGYLREDLLRVPGSEVHHIVAQWRSETEFRRWIDDPAHARREAGPIAQFLLRDFRRRIFHPVPRPDNQRDPARAGEPGGPRTGGEAGPRTSDVLGGAR
jgi:heme-degrading monooxygenase HmoA